MAMLEVKNLKTSFYTLAGEVKAVNDTSFTLDRGQVLGMNPTEGKAGYTTLEAKVPKGEMSDYVVSLRQSSQGRGKFDFAVDSYEEVPAMVAQKIIAEHKIEEE